MLRYALQIRSIWAQLAMRSGAAGLLFAILRPEVRAVWAAGRENFENMADNNKIFGCLYTSASFHINKKITSQQFFLQIL